MKFSIFSFLLLSIFIFSSCEKGNYFKDKWDKEGKDEWIKDGDDKAACFDLVYPITYIMPDGSEVTGDNDEALNSAMKAWYAAHPDSKEKPALQYPVDVIFKDDITKTIHNEEEMIWAKKACDDKKGDICFGLVYPVTYNMPDGSKVSGVDEKQVWADIKAWYETHPDSAAKPALQYPVVIMFKDETTQTIHNEEEMILAKKDCFEEEE